MSPTRVNATRRFFLGGSGAVCSDAPGSASSLTLFSAVEEELASLEGKATALVAESLSPSTLAAGVKGGSPLPPLVCLFGVAPLYDGSPTFPKTGVAVGVTAIWEGALDWGVGEGYTGSECW